MDRGWCDSRAADFVSKANDANAQRRSRGECYRRDIGLSDRQIRASGLKDAADPQIELPGCGRCGGQTEIKAPVEIFALLLEVEWRPWIQPKRVDSGEKGICSTTAAPGEFTRYLAGLRDRGGVEIYANYGRLGCEKWYRISQVLNALNHFDAAHLHCGLRLSKPEHAASAGFGLGNAMSSHSAVPSLNVRKSGRVLGERICWAILPRSHTYNSTRCN